MKFDDLREQVCIRLPKHRKAMKDKLTSMGYDRLSLLKPSEYKLFSDFLNTLTP